MQQDGQKKHANKSMTLGMIFCVSSLGLSSYGFVRVWATWAVVCCVGMLRAEQPSETEEAPPARPELVKVQNWPLIWPRFVDSAICPEFKS